MLERKKILLTVISGAININIEDRVNKTFLYAITMTVKMICLLRNQNLILPHSFVMDLAQRFIWGFKMVSTVNGKT